jgi:RNA-directed DNA polymerase
MNEFDQFIKHELRAKYYARYTDDFVIVSDSRAYLEQLLPRIEEFLKTRLALVLHPNKVSIRKYRQGIDFLGYVCLPYRTQVRTKTQRRIFRKLQKQIMSYEEGVISEETLKATFNSYMGVLLHADTYHLSRHFKERFWIQMNS